MGCVISTCLGFVVYHAHQISFFHHYKEDLATTYHIMNTAASRESLELWTREPKSSLGLMVLGMCLDAALDGVSCALLRYRQPSTDGSLPVSVLKVNTRSSLHSLSKYS